MNTDAARLGLLEGIGGPIRMNQADVTGIDPTLESCCRREDESKRKKEALISTLRRHDRIHQAERQRRNILSDLSWGSGCRCCYDPKSDGGEYELLTRLRDELSNDSDARNDEVEEEASDTAEHSSDEDSEFDYLLQEEETLQQSRREELERVLFVREMAICHGYGTHRQMHPTRALKASGLFGSPTSVPTVLHLYDPEQTSSASLDLSLERLSALYRGTKFVRSNGRSVLLLNPKTDLDHVFSEKVLKLTDIPALIAIRHGQVTSLLPRLMGLTNNEGKVQEDVVQTWLNRANVLETDVPENICRIRPEEDALLENMMQEKMRMDTAKQDDYYRCGVAGCQKTFVHQHLGVSNDIQSGRLIDEEDIVPSKPVGYAGKPL